MDNLKRTMKKFLLLAGLIGIFVVAGVAVDSMTWQLDPDHSDAHFQVRHLGITNVQGDFPKLSGTAQIDDADISKSTMTATVDVGSIDTRVAARAEDLRS